MTKFIEYLVKNSIIILRRCEVDHLVIERLKELQKEAGILQKELEEIAQQIGFEIVDKITEAINCIVALEKSEYNMSWHNIFIQIRLACSLNRLNQIGLVHIIDVNKYLDMSIAIVDFKGEREFYYFDKGNITWIPSVKDDDVD